MTANDITPVIPVVITEVSSAASVSNSNTATYDIAPAAKPNPPGSNGANFSIKRYAGTANNG